MFYAVVDKEEEESTVLGIATLPPKSGSNMSYVITARYSPESSAQNPVIQVSIDGAGYPVYIKEVNAKSASLLEMFALCSYMDDVGIYDKENAESFARLRTYADYASAKGYWKGITGIHDYIHEKQDWDSIINAIKDDYLQENVYDRYLQCLKLMDLFDFSLLTTCTE